MRFKGLALTVGAAMLCFALPAFSQVTVVFQGEVDPSVQWGGDSAGIYTATVNGVLTQVICDDYRDNIGSGQTWKANVLKASSLNSSNIGQTMFGSKIGLDGYAEVATLVDWMFDGGAPLGATKADISAVIWNITTPGLGGLDTTEKNLLAYVVTTLGLGAMDDATAMAYLAKFEDLKILVPDPLNKPDSTNGGNPGQEFWMVPEGGAALLMLLLAAGTCFGAMRFRNGVAKYGTA